LAAGGGRHAIDDSLGGFAEKDIGGIAAVGGGDGVERGLHIGRTVEGVVGIGGDDVGKSALEEFEGGGAGGGSESAGDGEGGELQEAAVVDPGFELAEIFAEGGIALGVGDDGDEGAIEEP
jgi:hypothetical protein